MQYHQTPPGATARPAAKSVRFRLYAVTAVVVIVTAAFSSVMAAVFYPERPGGVSGHVGAVAIFTLLIALVGWIVYRIAGRSSLAGNITVIALAVLLFGLTPFGPMINRGASSARAAQNEAVFKELNANLQKQIRALQKRAAAGETVDLELGTFDLTTEFLKKCSQKMIGADSACAGAAAAEYEAIRDKIAAYMKGWDELGDRGAIASWALSPEDLEDAIAQVRRLRETNKEIQDRFVHLEQAIEKRMLAQGVDQRAVRASTRRFSQGYDLRTIMRVRRLDDIAAEGYIEMAQILLDEWGAWEWDAEQEMTLFQSDEAIERFNAAVQKIQDAAAEQEGL